MKGTEREEEERDEEEITGDKRGGRKWVNRVKRGRD